VGNNEQHTELDLNRAARNWRYHMLHRLWMTKDNTAQVEQFSETAEKGVYVFFDPTTWERVRVSWSSHYHSSLER
jgi:CCR4-NOT transcription complex subunit 2